MLRSPFAPRETGVAAAAASSASASAAAKATPTKSIPTASDVAAEEEEEEDDRAFVNPVTGEVNGPRGPEPTRFGDWERKGRCSDF